MNSKKVILLYISYDIIINGNTEYLMNSKKVILFGCWYLLNLIF